ncbi:sterol carrier family protein [Streptomyces sp. NRRL F-5065]|uniref:sterol carrier family protein n=1 Tax=Streptomyces sp. NRRL F-5065 TaxID=1463855 RepID=UPI0004C19A45|nr:sterol carrier family protein [Streptomyces sp. NRRL F-5065]
MPPAVKRARRYDPARTRAAVLAQLSHLRGAARALTPEHLALPVRAGERTVGALLAGAHAALTEGERLLAEPAPARQDLRLADWPRLTTLPVPDAGGPAPAPPADPADPAALDALLADAGRRFAAALDAHPGTRLLPTGAGALPLADHVVTRAADLVVRADDLDTAVPGLDVPRDRQALAAATRLLADALAAGAPGGSTEVRVPPYAVVQCVEGPRHTRGTPPNVVETDPLTWVRLATGRLTWADAVAGALVSASGGRADLGALLPLRP